MKRHMSVVARSVLILNFFLNPLFFYKDNTLFKLLKLKTSYPLKEYPDTKTIPDNNFDDFKRFQEKREEMNRQLMLPQGLPRR